jgi:hypothetical protein
MSRKRQFYSNAAEKPRPVPFDEAGIPADLRAEARWVPWRFKWKPDRKGGGKWDKVPLGCKSGRPADCNNPTNWGTLDEALRHVRAGSADGVGFALTGGYAGGDLDDHRDPDTGKLTPYAQRALILLPSYAEVSPSGTGLKIIGRGRFPFAKSREKYGRVGLELFNGGFFAMTGVRLAGAAAEVQDLQPAIDAHLAELTGQTPDTGPEAESDQGPGRAPSSGKVPTADEVETRVRSHPEGRALMAGDTSRYDGDHSAADLGLCNLIAFYSAGDSTVIDAVFRRSELLRDKWDEKHAADGRTYGQMTVAKALSDRREFFDWSDPVRVTLTWGADGVAGGSTPPAAEAPWPILDPAALHGLAGEFVELVAPHTEADPVALLVQFLVMFGSAAGRGASVRAERTPHHLNEFAVLVGASAKGRKGTSEGWVSDLMRLVDPTWATDCRTGKLASGEALVFAVRDAVFRTNEDGEQVLADPGVRDKRLLITEGEFSVILKIAAKETNTLSDQLRDAWDGKDLNNKSKVNPCAATAPHVSIVAHTTESDLRLLLTENAMANGFANRFLFFAVRRARELPFGGAVDEQSFQVLAGRVAERLTFARKAGVVTWGPEAAAEWDGGKVYSRLARDRYGLAGNLTSRAEAHVLRLAVLYAVLDGSAVIGKPHLAAALAVWEYAEQTAYRLFGGQTGVPLADDILKLLRQSPGGRARWELHQEVGKNIPAERFEAALELLAGAGWVRSETRKTGGRDAEVWIAVER